MEKIHNNFPEAPLVIVGFSMGANIVTKFIGENSKPFSPSQSRLKNIVAAVSVCQGFDVWEGSKSIPEHPWISYILTKKMLQVVKRFGVKRIPII